MASAPSAILLDHPPYYPASRSIGERVLWRGMPGTIVGVGSEVGFTVYDFAPDDGGPVRWGYADQFTSLDDGGRS